MQGQQSSRTATPPVPTASHSVPPSQAQSAHKSRGVSPAGTTIHQHSSSLQPSRASSAPRVTGLTQHQHHVVPPSSSGGSNVRTSSQPMGQQQPQHHSGYGQPSPMVFPASPAAPRGTSPVPTQVGGGMPITVGRSAVSQGSSHPRNPSPMGIAPSSPAGNVCMGGQVPFGSVTAIGHRSDALSGTSRGRSPPPTANAGVGPHISTSVRAPRAVT